MLLMGTNPKDNIIKNAWCKIVLILLTTVAERGSRKMASPKNEPLPDDAPSKKVVLLEESPRKNLPGDTPSKKALLLEDTPTKDEFLPEDTPEKKENEMMMDKDYDDEDEDYDDSNLPEKTRHPFGTSLKLFPLHAWLYILYIVLAILLPIFGTLLIICGNYTNTGYFSLFAILNYPWPKLKLEDPNATATSLELLQVGTIFVFPFFASNQRSFSARLLDIWFLLLVLRPLPCLRHRGLPQAALVHRHHHPHPPPHLDCQGKETLGPRGLGRCEEGCRRCPAQGEGGRDDEDVDNHSLGRREEELEKFPSR